MTTDPIHKYPFSSCTSLISFHVLNSNISTTFPSLSNLIPMPFLPTKRAKYLRTFVISNGRNLTINFPIRGLEMSHSTSFPLCELIPTQNSPSTFRLTLSGNPGNSVTTSSFPAFAVLSQNLYNLHVVVSTKSRKSPLMLNATPFGNLRLSRRTVAFFALGSNFINRPESSPVMMAET